MTAAQPVPERLSEVKRKLFEKYVRGEITQAEHLSEGIRQRQADEAPPLSLVQEQLWYREQIEGIAPLYNEAITIRHSGPLDAATLARTLTEIIRRHQIWRTSYEVGNGAPFQVIHPAPSSFAVQTVDLRGLSQGEAESEIVRITTSETRCRFDLRQVPLLRATLFRSDGEDDQLFLAAHLSIIDGISVYQVLPIEIATLYAAFSNGRPSPLPEPCIQYADYSYWQRQTFTAERRAEQVNYWREMFSGEVPVLGWPAEPAKPVSRTYRGAIRKFTLSPAISGFLKKLSSREGFTLFTILVASLSVLLHSYTGQEDLVIGTPSPSGRKRPETQLLLGYFLNPIALRIDLRGDPTFHELLSRIRETLAEALCYDDVPIEVLARELQLKTECGRNPFFTVAISLQPKMPASATGWRVTSMDADSGGAPWDLYLAFIDSEDGMLGRAQYNPDVFEPDTITDTIMQLQALMSVAAAGPKERLSTLSKPFRTAR